MNTEPTSNITRKHSTFVEIAAASRRINEDRELIDSALKSNSTNILTLARKYGVTTRSMSAILDGLGIREIRRQKADTNGSSPNSGVVDFAKLQRVVRRLCHKLNVDFDSI